MKTSLNGSSRSFIVALIAVLFIGGGVYVYLQNKSQPAVTTTITQTAQPSSVSGWKTYINSDHGYTVDYPSSASLALAGASDSDFNSSVSTSTKDWYKSGCVDIGSASTSPDWYIEIATSGSLDGPCGATGLGRAGTPLDAMGDDVITVDGRKITATHRGDFFEFILGSGASRIDVEYSTHATTTAGIQADLDSIHAILSTLKRIPNFVPPNPPELPGRG